MNVAASTRDDDTDIVGSIAGALDAASGTLTKFGYQPFGENPVSDRRRLPPHGTPFDPETSLCLQPSGFLLLPGAHIRTRLGHSAAGSDRYLAGQTSTPYVDNDPLNRVDPYGLFR